MKIQGSYAGPKRPLQACSMCQTLTWASTAFASTQLVLRALSVESSIWPQPDHQSEYSTQPRQCVDGRTGEVCDTRDRHRGERCFRKFKQSRTSKAAVGW